MFYIGLDIAKRSAWVVFSIMNSTDMLRMSSLKSNVLWYFIISGSIIAVAGLAGCGVPKTGTGMAPERTSVSVLRLLELLEPDPLDSPDEGRELFKMYHNTNSVFKPFC